MNPKPLHEGGPEPILSDRPPSDPAEVKAWFRATFGEMPAPTADMDAETDDAPRERRREALASFERTLPKAYQWAKFSAGALGQRVGGAATTALADKTWRKPKVVFMGAAGAGKTSLAVACLRRWVAENGRAAGFFHAYALGVARLQHAAGRGEPEIVERAMKWPMVLVDDLGSERAMSGCAVPDVIFLRHAEQLPLWVTTGMTRAQLVTRYGEGIVRRLFERAFVVEWDGVKTANP
jgi:DNA replication protein DnaC